MKRDFLVLLILLICAAGTTAWGDCPEEPLDRGRCDTMYVEPWAPDIADTAWARSGLHVVRVPIYVNADVHDAYDSISAFVIPLCYTHTNSPNSCSLTADLNVEYDFDDNSIFRHMPDNATATVHNWMKDLATAGGGKVWSTLTLDLGDNVSHFWMSFIPSSSRNQRYGLQTKTLLATMTFKMEDTMTICVDTCTWGDSKLAWSVQPEEGGVAVSKTPRSGTGTSSYQVCFPIFSDVKEIEGSNASKPSEFSLSQNYPNPFNPVTNLRFTISKTAHVKIELFNIVGQKVRTLVDEEMKAGVYSADWDGTDEVGNRVSSGIYFYRIQAGDFSDMKKMVMLK